MALSGKKVAFVGLGNMGYHMAMNLLKHGGCSVSVYDINAAAVDKFKSEGGLAMKEPQDCEQADALITMLPSNSVVLSTFLDPKRGVLAAKQLKPNMLLIDSSTVSPSVSKTVQDVAKSRNVSFVDAPVSGGVNGAKAGTLTFMVGGCDKEYERTKPILQVMGKNIVHCGQVGSGQVAKLCNNMVLATSMIAISEAMNLGIRLGMDPKTLAAIMNSSTARCWSSDTYNPVPGILPNVPSANDYEGGFGSQLMIKDLGLVLEAARDANAPIPLGSASHALYQTMTQANPALSKKDFSVIFKFLNGKA